MHSHCTCMHVLSILPYAGPWRSFISTYTAEHRELVDTDTCDMCFNDLPTAESEEAETHRLLEGEGKGEESEEGDRACVVVREEGEPIELVCKPRKGSRPPSVLFTGLSNVLVKKYRQVREEEENKKERREH